MLLIVVFYGIFVLNSTVLGDVCQQIKSLTLIANEFDENLSYCTRRNDIVVICETSIHNLTAFSKHFCLESIKWLEINSTKTAQPYQIDPSIFEQVAALKELSLANVKIPQRSFDDLSFLEMLYIGESYFEFLDEAIFKNQNLLKTLWITQCPISHISKNFFKNMELLEALVLSGNGIKTIEENAFDNLKNIIVISLYDNQIHTIDHVFQNLPKLTFLSLSGNQLNVSWQEFINLPSVVFFDVSDNKIEIFDEKQIAKALPSLLYLKIDDNLADTEDMSQFAHNLGHIINNKSFSVHFTNILA